LIVFLLALTIRVAYVIEDAEVLGLDVSRLDQTDNHVFAEWARTIADGDLLCLNQPHAYHHWTAEIAPEGRWIEWYGGELTFHQAPLYPYMIAAVYALAGDEHVYVGLFQALLGALTCWLTLLIGQRVVSRRAGFIAGLLLALCGPYYFYDAFILRDGPMAFFVALSTLALVHAIERDRVLHWFLAGASLGLFTLAKETGLPLLLCTLAGLAIWRRTQPRRLLLMSAALLLGWLLLTAPAFARNIHVGTSPFRLSTRGPEVFVTGNAQGQSGVGWNPPSDTMRRILLDSNFSLPRAMAYTLATHRADPWGYVELLWNKTEAFFNSHEVPNNVDFYLHRSHLRTLRLGFVSLAFLAPAALLGLLLGFPRRRQLAAPYLMLGAVSVSVIALYILARFRLQALPLMAIFAGLTVDWFATALEQRRPLRLGMAALALALLTSWTWSDSNPFGEKNKYTGIMLKLAKIGDFEKAEKYRDMLIAVIDVDEEEIDPLLAERLAQLYDAFEHFEQALSLPPDSGAHHMFLARGYSVLIDVTKRGDLKDFVTLATRHFNRARSLDPDIVGALHGLGKVAFKLENHPSIPNRSPDLGPALARFRAELELHPDHGISHRDAGLIFHAWKRWREAMQHLLAAVRFGSEDASVLASIARMSIDPSARHQDAVLDGDTPIPMFDEERAFEYAQEALALDDDNPNVLYLVADVMLQLRHWDAAVEHLDKLIGLQPWRRNELSTRISAFRQDQRNKLEQQVVPGRDEEQDREPTTNDDEEAPP
jgi:4-amino-4-deoxy-L-arabinose transferase-like glycosyltransferase